MDAAPRTVSCRPTGAEFLRFEHAAVRAGHRLAFPRTDWTWRVGEHWAILGPDDSGKSLLIEALLGLRPLARGELHGPTPPTRPQDSALPTLFAHVSPGTQRRLAVQESSYYQSRWQSGLPEGQRTVADFLSQASVEERNPFEVQARRGDARAFRRRQRAVLRSLGLQPLWPRRLAHLSNGELRKTLLAHALLKAPRLLVLEDPFAGLDAATRRLLRGVIERLMRHGTPVLVSTHRPEDLPDPVTHVLLVHRGRIVAQGPREDVLSLWRSRFGRSFAPTRTALRDRETELVGRNRDRPVTPLVEPTTVRREPRPTGSRKREPPSAPLVALRGVNVTVGRCRILRDVNWTLHEGERWALRGPNGAGKTTLLNLIQGDHPQAYAQDVRLFGRGLDSTQTIWELRQRLGWMSPELHQHYPGEWEVLDVICSGYFHSVGLYEPCSRARRDEARRWLRQLGLAAQAREPFGALTFGQQRLVLLARAAVHRPRLLVLDEPAQGLDAAQRRVLLDTVDTVVARTDCSLIFVTHRAGELPWCITHQLRLAGGRVRTRRG